MATMKKASKAMAKTKLKKAQSGGNATPGVTFNGTSKKKIGPALGIGIPVTAMAAAGANMIKNAVKRRKEKKATEEETRRALENAKSQRTKKSQVPTPFNKRKVEKARRVVAKTGGIKKYQTGGGTDPYAYKKKMTDTAKYWGSQPDGEFDEIAYTRDNLSDMENTNAMDRSFYNSLGPVEPGRVRAQYSPTFSPNRIAYTKSKLADLEKAKQKRGGATKATYKTGGMVNPNAKVSKQTTPGSKGVTPKVNPKATAAKRATGRTGGTSKAPRTAKPKNK